MRHAATGEPAIYVNPDTTSHIVGLAEDESEALIERLTDQIEDSAFRWEHSGRPATADVGQPQRPDAYRSVRLAGSARLCFGQGSAPRGRGPGADPRRRRHGSGPDLNGSGRCGPPQRWHRPGARCHRRSGGWRP
ncbi:MAG: hypothetical protein ACFCVK_18380 [Acidimicrobiales bacterium]